MKRIFSNPIHINKTGRVCFNEEAREHMGSTKFMVWANNRNGWIQLSPADEATRGTLVRVSRPRTQRRPTLTTYISEGQARPLLKPFGFDGSRSYDPETKLSANGGFEFRLDKRRTDV